LRGFAVFVAKGSILTLNTVSCTVRSIYPDLFKFFRSV